MIEVYCRQGRWKFGGGASTNHLFSVLPPGAEDGEIPGDRLSGSSASSGTSEITLHVQNFFLAYSSGERGKLSAASL